jgi:hypothetical protein
MSRPKIQRDWWLKSVSGTVLGSTLALALVGLWAWWGPGGISASNKVQFNMWLIAPLWMGVLSACFFVRTGRQVVAGLLLANGLAYAVLWWTRQMAGA